MAILWGRNPREAVVRAIKNQKDQNGLTLDLTGTAWTNARKYKCPQDYIDVINSEITSRVKTFEDACRVLNLDPDVELAFVKHLTEPGRKAIEALKKLIIIARALNEGWYPDWSNQLEWKHWPWIKKDPASIDGLMVDFYGDNTNPHSAIDAGSRLCYRTPELAIYAGIQFKEIYQELEIH